MKQHELSFFDFSYESFSDEPSAVSAARRKLIRIK